MARRYTHVSWNVVHLAGSNIFFGGNRSIAMMDISTVGRFDRAFNSFSPLSYPFERILDEGERESFRISREAWIRIKVPISEIQIFSKGEVHRTLLIITIIIIHSKDPWDRSSTRERILREAWIKIKVPISEIQIFSKGVVHRTLIIIIITTIIMDWAFKYLQNWQTECRLTNPIGGGRMNRWRIWITISDIYLRRTSQIHGLKNWSAACTKIKIAIPIEI